MLIESISSEAIKILIDTEKDNVVIGDIIQVVNKSHQGVLCQINKINSIKEISSKVIAIANIIGTIKDENAWSKWCGNIPSKDSMVSKVKPEEIIFYLSGTSNNALTIGSIQNTSLPIKTDNLNGITTIFSDNKEQKINTLEFLANNILKSNQKVLVCDFNGEFPEMGNALKISAGSQFKLPLNSKGIEKLYEKTLSEASLETKAVIEDIFMQIQTYTDSNEVGFISLNSFKDVIKKQIQEKPLPELIVLNNRLKKLQKQGVFAQSEKEFSIISGLLKEYNLVVIDFSNIPTSWHKEFYEYILDSINNVYLLSDNSKQIFDSSIINKLSTLSYKKVLKPFIASAYQAETTNKLINETNNFILFSPKAGQNIFPEYSKYLQRLAYSEALILGEATKGLPLFIELSPSKETSSEQAEMDFETDDFADIAESFVEAEITDYSQDYISEEVPDEEAQVILQQFDEMNALQSAKTNVVETNDNDFSQEFAEIEAVKSSQSQKQIEEELPEDDTVYVRDDEQIDVEDILHDFEDIEELKELQTPEPQVAPPPQFIKEVSAEPENFMDDFEEIEEIQEIQAPRQDYTPIKESVEELPIETEDFINDFEEIEETQIAQQEDSISKEIYEDVDSLYTSPIQEETQEESMDLDYEDFDLDEDEEEVKQDVPTPDIPIYKTPIEDKPQMADAFKKGDKVQHEKYGVGSIDKIISYGNKKLLSIQFENIGRRLLDPQLATVTKVG